MKNPTQHRQILDFIEKRFSNTDANWNNGNCYYFALILHYRFNKCGDIVYDPIVGHFKYKYDEHCYDYNGLNDDNMESLISFKVMRIYDELWWKRLIRDCVL